MCDPFCSHYTGDPFLELEEQVYSEALRYYSRGELGRLRSLYIRAARLGLDGRLLSDIEELIYRLEEEVLRRIEESLGAAAARPY